MIIINAGYTVNVSLAAFQSVTVSGRGAVIAAVSGLGISAGNLGTLADQPATYGPYTVAGVVSITAVGRDCSYEVGAERGVDDFSTYMGQVATRTLLCNQTDLTRFQSMSKSIHIARDNMSSWTIAIPNWYVASLSAPSDFTEANLGTTMTVTASVEYPLGSARTPFTFGGNTTGAIAAGATGFPDFISKNIPDGAAFAIYIWYSNSGGIFYNGTGYSGVSDGLIRGVTTPDLTQSTAAVSSAANSLCFRPVAIIGQTSKKSVLILGDSIAAGTGDSADPTGDMGIFARSIGPRYAYINAGVGSDSIARFLASGTRRTALARYVSHVFIHSGTNDLGVSTQAQLVADINSMVGLFPNQEVFFSPLIPRLASSTDKQVTITGQTKTGTEAARLLINYVIRSGQITGLSGWFDTSRPIESLYDASNVPQNRSGFWATDPPQRTVTDGAITSGTSTFTSATASFSVNDTGQNMVIIGSGFSGAPQLVRMTYVNGTTVTLTSTQTGAAASASTTVSGATAYIRVQPTTDDGVHPNSFAYKLIAASGVVSNW